MYRLKTTANFNVGGGISGEVVHDSTLMGKGTSESPLKVDQSKFAKPSDLNGKQDTLISGTNIKTINNQSILGSGNITIQGGLSSVAHDDTMTGAGTNASPLSINTSKIAQKSDIPDTSEFITKSVNDLTNYTKTSDLGSLATKNTVNYETEVTNKPTIPSEVTEATVSGWGFTKNTGTYSKPSGGIPKSDLDSSVQASLSKADTALQTEQYTGTYSKPSGGIPKTDLASAVQTSLSKADTALQSYTEQYTGTITGITMNGASKGTSGVVDLGTVITNHQDISGKEDKSNKVTSISSSSTDTEYPSAKAVYDLAIGDVDLSIPSYVKEEAESTLTKAFSHKNLGRTIRFIAISDSHNDEGNISHDYTQISNRHCGQAAKYISDRIALDFVSFLGDATWAGVATSDNYADQLKDDIQQMNEFLSDGFRGIPNIRLVGNHDQLMTTDGYRIQNDGAYNFFGRYNAGNKVGNTNYGYYDIESQKVRVIYLNTSDSTNSTAAGTLLAMSQDQKNWLCETLIDVNTKTDASSWKIILLSHAPLDFANFNIDTALLVAYTNGGTYGNYTFTNHDAKIICNFHGHIHSYSYGYIQGKIRRATIPNSNFYDNNHYKNISSYAQWADTTTYPKTANSRTDTTLSLVTIDLDNEICYIDNYGAGIDRVFSVDYSKTPTSITNITYSGATTVESTIDTNAIAYTIGYSDGSSNTLSGGVTVSPATIQQVGNNTVTVSYTADGVTVSENITIVGTAKPVENLFNLDRTYATLPQNGNVMTALDDTKAYTNVLMTGVAASTTVSCTASDVTTDSVTVTESGLGGLYVVYPINLSGLSAGTYNLSFDYSGVGKLRCYYAFGANGISGQQDRVAINEDTAGTSGNKSYDIEIPHGTYTYLIVGLSSNTGKTKTFTNVKFEKVS